jgi:hypothetical protein
MKRILSSAILASLSMAVAQAVDVGYFTDQGVPGNQALAIVASGHTPVEIVDITTFDFTTVQVVMLNEASNEGFSNALINRLGDLDAYVGNGGVLVMHDRFVAFPDGVPGMHPFLLGQPSIQVQRDFNNDADIDLLPAGEAAFPGLTNTSLDGGNSSSHGFGFATSLPLGATAYMTRGGAPEHIVSFSYGYGLGSVYYSTIPLDFYLNGGGDEALDEVFTYVGVQSINAGLGQGPAIPEPGEYAALAGAGLLGFAVWRRCRRGRAA